MKKRKLIIIVVLLVAVIVVIGWIFFWRDGASPEEQATMEGNPIDVTLDFYDPWLAAVRATSTDPYQVGLATDKILSEDLRAKLASAQSGTGTGLDPVLCQSAIELGANLSARPIYENDDQAQVLVLLVQEGAHNQAVVTLNKQQNGWYINDIECSFGETAPEREFSFEHEGHLLKDSVPEPLDPQYWHLVYEQRGQKGYAVPLFFGSESSCQYTGTEPSPCDPGEFKEASRVLVKGEMTESGVDVKHLELLQ